MCDYSLQMIASRPAAVGDKLVTKNFGTGTNGFAEVNTPDMATCVLPGTELAFENDMEYGGILSVGRTFPHRTAIFRQINKDQELQHHDALELPDGTIVMLTWMQINQKATVLQLPAQPRNEAEVEEQRRVEVVG